MAKSKKQTKNVIVDKGMDMTKKMPANINKMEKDMMNKEEMTKMMKKNMSKMK